MGIEVRPVETRRIYQAIIEQILEMIRKDELRVGEKLPPERQLAEMFRVSRPSVREALRVMEVMGLLERRPGGGSVVTDLNIAKLLDMIAPLFLKREGMAIELVELRYLVETRAAELAAAERAAVELSAADASATDAPKGGISALRECLGRMEKAAAAGDAEEEARADIAFHEALLGLSGNYVLAQAARFITAVLEGSVRFGRRVILEGGYGSRHLLEQHRRIAAAVESGDPAGARKAMEAHMKLVFEYYLRAQGGDRREAGR